MFETIYWMMGLYEAEVEACPKSKRQKYLVLKQIKESHLKLKPVKSTKSKPILKKKKKISFSPIITYTQNSRKPPLPRII